jgi:hypothetical protein
MILGTVYLQLHVKFGFAVSTVNIMKNSVRIKEYVKGMAMMKLKIITEKCEGTISEMDKLINNVDGRWDTETSRHGSEVAGIFGLTYL